MTSLLSLLTLATALAVTDPCDGLDNDNDLVVDQLDRSRTPENDPLCVIHVPDLDLDGYGTNAATGRQRVCLCPGYEAFEVLQVDTDSDGSADVRPVAPPEVCPYRQPDGSLAYGHLIDGLCYIPETTDCDDGDALIRPRRAGEAVVEYLDRADHDCDGAVWLAELDCDDDGALPWLPLRSGALAAAPEVTPVRTAAEVGLASCVDAEAPRVSCDKALDGSFTPTCNPTTGLWMVRFDQLLPSAAENAVHLAPSDNTVCGTWDCDDQCTARCEGQAERCDGLDNDCADGAANAGQVGGVPAAMRTDEAVVPGAVAPDEALPTGVLPFTCNAGATQRASSTAGCTTRRRASSVDTDVEEDEETDTDVPEDTGTPEEGGCTGCASGPGRASGAGSALGGAFVGLLALALRRASAAALRA